MIDLLRTPVVVIATLVAGGAAAEPASGSSPDAPPVGVYQISAAAGGTGVWRLDTRTGDLSYCWVHDIAPALAVVAEDAKKEDPFAARDSAMGFGLSPATTKEGLGELAAVKKAGRPPLSFLVVSCSSRRQ
jgi:hypothetical protein